MNFIVYKTQERCESGCKAFGGKYEIVVMEGSQRRSRTVQYLDKDQVGLVLVVHGRERFFVCPVCGKRQK